MICLLQKHDGLFISPEEQIAAVTPYWQQLTEQQRVLVLTVDLATLRQRARQLSEHPQLQAGMQQRLTLPAEAVYHLVQGAKADHKQSCLGFVHRVTLDISSVTSNS